MNKLWPDHPTWAISFQGYRLVDGLRCAVFVGGGREIVADPDLLALEGWNEGDEYPKGLRTNGCVTWEP